MIILWKRTPLSHYCHTFNIFRTKKPKPWEPGWARFCVEEEERRMNKKNEEGPFKKERQTTNQFADAEAKQATMREIRALPPPEIPKARLSTPLR